MLAHWFNRVGSVIAPDEKAESQQQQQRQQQDDADFWQFLAPDPNFEPPRAPPSDAFPTLMDQNVDGIRIPCEHCNRPTRLPASLVSSVQKALESASASNASPTTPSTTTPSAKVSFQTPTPGKRSASHDLTSPGTSERLAEVDDLVLSASKDMAVTFQSPVHRNKMKLFTLCSNLKELNQKKYETIEKSLTKDPTLLEVRSRGLGLSCPDGYTLLMATAHADHVKAAKIIMSVAESSGMVPIVVNARTFLGKSPLHIAAEAGSVEMVTFLREYYNSPVKNEPVIEGSGSVDAPSSEAGATKTPEQVASTMPLDLLGRTPLGTGMLSPEARKVRKELKTKLLTDYDESIFGPFIPYDARTGWVQFAMTAEDEATDNQSKGIAYGNADIPGMRVEMEDSICQAALSSNVDDDGSGTVPPSFFVLGVCDGHGDHRAVSDFVARNLPPFLKECIGPSNPAFSIAGESEEEAGEHWRAIWSSTAMKVDDSLRATGIPGGSTGVFALLSSDSIVVANVGDSRCILIQAAESNGEGQEASQTPPSSLLFETVAVAMSEDHKPNLPNERARIEKAGLQVESVEFNNDDGSEEVIHKVRRSEKDMLAVSRAFGDFEYKDNTTLGPHEQAVSCEPDVVVHKRDPKHDLFLVMCCDGIFDVMSNDEVKNFVVEHVQKTIDEGREVILPQVGDGLCRKCFRLGSEDNMTAVVVALQPDMLNLQSSESPRKALSFKSP